MDDFERETLKIITWVVGDFRNPHRMRVQPWQVSQVFFSEFWPKNAGPRAWNKVDPELPWNSTTTLPKTKILAPENRPFAPKLKLLFQPFIFRF